MKQAVGLLTGYRRMSAEGHRDKAKDTFMRVWVTLKDTFSK